MTRQSSENSNSWVKMVCEGKGRVNREKVGRYLVMGALI